MKNKIVILEYHLNSIAIVFCFLFIPKNAYASGMEGIGYLIGGFFIFIAAICGSYIKRLFDLPAKERGVLKELSFLVMIAEFFIMIFSLIIVRFLEIKIEPEFKINMLYFSVPIYFILAIFPNLLLYQKENEKYLKTLSNATNVGNAFMSSIFTPIISSAMAITAAYQSF